MSVIRIFYPKHETQVNMILQFSFWAEIVETECSAKFAWLHSRFLSSKYVNWVLAHFFLAYERLKALPVMARIVSVFCVISLEQKYT